MPRGKKAEQEIKTEAAVETAAPAEEKPKRKAGRPPKAAQEARTFAKRPAAKKAAKATEDKPKKTGGRTKAAPTAKNAAKKTAKTAADKPKRKYVRKAQTKVEEAVAALEPTKEEIIDKIISTDISVPAETAPEADNTAKFLLDLNEEETKVLKAFVKALTAALRE